MLRWMLTSRPHAALTSSPSLAGSSQRLAQCWPARCSAAANAVQTLQKPRPRALSWTTISRTACTGVSTASCTITPSPRHGLCAVPQSTPPPLLPPPVMAAAEAPGCSWTGPVESPARQLLPETSAPERATGQAIWWRLLCSAPPAMASTLCSTMCPCRGWTMETGCYSRRWVHIRCAAPPISTASLPPTSAPSTCSPTCARSLPVRLSSAASSRDHSASTDAGTAAVGTCHVQFHTASSTVLPQLRASSLGDQLSNTFGRVDSCEAVCQSCGSAGT
mmetsp:Transcript_18784/g.56795  ORF Transcript_18784/g.56795 Transcript_18784/m.56795 type:complete len:277 (-) Transcript_18784:850-1680(-)